MSLVSMTGFARADGTHGDADWHWEAKSVNGKSLDVRCRFPPGFESLEQEARALAAKTMRRGNIQLSLQLKQTSGVQSLRINEAGLDQILQAAERLRGKVPDAPPVTIEGLLALRGVLEAVDDNDDDDAVKALHVALADSLKKVFAQLQEMRVSEGKELNSIVSSQIDAIERLAGQARDCPARAPEAIQQKIREQIERILGASGQFDPERLHAEAILIAAKADVQEELDRLDAHVAAARALLAAEEAVGRKLDFLAQEFNREANTLCSKANDPALSVIGLELKAVIDQLREQVQNIE